MGANISEFLVKNIVQKHIFPNITWGHQYKASENERLPDICSDDSSTGIEVVKVELGIDHLLIDLFEALNDNKNKKKSCEQIRNEFEQYHSDEIKQIKDTLYLNDENPLFRINKYNGEGINLQSEQCWPIFDDLSRHIDYTNKFFEKQIRAKFNKLNNGNYDGVNEVYLAIVSIHRSKDDVAIKGAFESFWHISHEFPSVKFKGLILVYSRLIAWEDNGKVSKKKIGIDEFNRLIRNSRSEFIRLKNNDDREKF